MIQFFLILFSNFQLKNFQGCHTLRENQNFNFFLNAGKLKAVLIFKKFQINFKIFLKSQGILSLDLK